MTDRISIHITDRVAYIQMDDGKANAIQEQWCEQLNAALDEAEHQNVDCVVLTGRRGFFSAGLDMKRLPSLTPPQMSAAVDLFVATNKRLFLFPRPIVAVSMGHVMAGGLIVYLAADHRIALRNDKYQFVMNEVANGIPLMGVNAGICEAAIPAPYRLEILLHSHRLTAQQMFDRQILQDLCDDDAEIQIAVENVIAHWRSLNHKAYALTKKFLRQEIVINAEQRSDALLSELAKDFGQGNALESLQR